MAKPRESEPVPFIDGKPIEAAVLYRLLGDSEEVERLDGPRPADCPSSGGGRRHIPPVRDEDSDLQRLEELATLPFLWELIEKLDEFHSSRRPERRPGRKRGYKLIDIQVIEAGTHIYGNSDSAWRNLKDPHTWERLCRAVQETFPNDQNRRLSKKAPSRHQIYRARRDYFSGEALEAFRRWSSRTALEAARDIGIFNPKAGSWTHPHKTQCIVADSSWTPGPTKHHRDEPFDPRTGKTRKFDPYADYHHTRDGKPTKIPGRDLVMLSCRTQHGNERIIIDSDFMPPKKSPKRKNRNDADFAIDMLEDLLAENGDLLCGGPGGRSGGLRGFIYDMAMDSEASDRVLNNKVLPIVKVPRLKGGKYRGGSLGPHKFTTRRGSTERHDIKTFNGSMWVLLPDSRGTEISVPLRRKHLYWGDEAQQGIIAYCEVEIPYEPEAPRSLRGATTTVRLNSTDEEIHNNPHTRRTRSLRPIPEADPDFEIHGGREDIESTFSNLKYCIRGRLRSIHEDFNRFNIISYQLLWLSRALSAHHKRTATTATHAIPIAA